MTTPSFPAYLRYGKAPDIANPRDRALWRFFEMLPGLLSWGTLLGAVVVSWAWPVLAAVFIILFDVYWLLKTVFLSAHLIAAYRKMRTHLSRNWLSAARSVPVDSVRFLGAKTVEDFWHVIILPFYNESAEVVRSSLEGLRQSNYPLSRFIVVLATEARAGAQGAAVASYMQKEFAGAFGEFLITVHPADTVGEIAGKGSNETWAGREVQRHLDQRAIPYEQVILSVFDSDTRPYPEYFGCLTYLYLTCAHPFRSSYQPVPVFNNNLWEAPFFSRVVASSSTIWQMMQQESEERLSTFSSHSMSFRAIVDMGFWQTNIVSEDSRVYWQALLTFNGDYRVIPMHYPVSMDACLADTLKQTAINQYKQQRRWAWGSENIPYLFFGFVKNASIPLRTKLYHALTKLEGYWSWSTNSLLILSLGWLPLLLGGEQFNRTVLSYQLPLVARTLMTLALIGMFASAGVSFLMLPPHPRLAKLRTKLVMLLQWVFLPISVIFLGAFPGLDAQTRLMVGAYMGFWVTDKSRVLKK